MEMKFKPYNYQYPIYLLLITVYFFSCIEKNSKNDNNFNYDTTITKVTEQITIADSQILADTKTDSAFQKVSVPNILDTSKKYIYLTFDDGPQHGTVACFDLCKQLKVKSIFFMVGAHASSINLRNIVRRIDDNYPQTLLANHSKNHARNNYHSFYLNDSLAVSDIQLAQKTLKVPFKITRLPGSNSWVLKNRIKAEPIAYKVCKRIDSLGYNILGWDIEWNFDHTSANPIQSADVMIIRIRKYFEKKYVKTPNHLVLLMHDRMFRNDNYIDSLHKFIATLQKDTNYIFETVDHYPGLKPLN